MKKLGTLVMMQLKDKLDLSFAKNKRKLIFKIVLFAVLLAAVTAAFYLLFSVSVMLSVFSFVGGLPDTVVTVMFTVIQLMSVITCTVGLTRALYMTADNRVLLTLPVPANSVFLSKLIIYYIFELKKNVTFTIPMYLAYGIVNGAVWYYYPWMMFSFLFISLLPVAIGALLSIPALFISTFVSHFKWLQAILTLGGAALVTWGIFAAVNAIPANINLVGQWGSISVGIQKFLKDFASVFYPYHCLNLMVVGGTLKISASLFGWNTLVYFGILAGVIAAFTGGAFLLARPLFFKMAAKQFEFEKTVVPPKKNQVHKKEFSPLSEYAKISFRSGRYVVKTFVEFVLPALAVFFLNKLYAAMATSYTGQNMTKAFNLLVLLIMLLSFNSEYAAVYSREGSARYLIKTRPARAEITLTSKLVPRAVVSTAAAVVATVFYALVAKPSVKEAVMIGFIAVFVNLAHLLWSAEMDLMKPQSDQYETVGMEFDNPNERNSTILAVLLSALFAFLLYFLSRDGIVSATLKILAGASLFLAARIYLYFTRVKLYYAEK